MSYAETAEIVQDMPACEDFDHSRLQNYRGMDFDRKWNHSPDADAQKLRGRAVKLVNQAGACAAERRASK
ncbi:MAG: hypothetical protein VB096_02520 [Pseudoflavonifractor sp.]|nr:hypothetical protein [Pseudoflavonifractor sp.]